MNPTASPKQKPLDRWLALGSIAVGILFFLLPKSPSVIVGSLVAIAALLLFPIWNFWWIEDAVWRRIGALAALVLALVIVGAFVWPVPAGGDTLLSTAVGRVWYSVTHVDLCWRYRTEGVLFVFVARVAFIGVRHALGSLKDEKEIRPPKGFLDYKLDAEDALQALPLLLGKLTLVTEKVGPSLDKHTLQLVKARTTEQQVGVSKRAARSLDQFSAEYDKVVCDYEATGTRLVEGLDGWSLWLAKTSNQAVLASFILSLREFIPVLSTSTQRIEQYIAAMVKGKGASSVLNAAIDRHVSSVSRVVSVNVSMRDMCVEALRRVEALPES
jgi:hypothetical protein